MVQLSVLNEVAPRYWRSRDRDTTTMEVVMPSKRTVARVCEQCQTDFLARPDDVRKGNAKFCSRKCKDDALRVDPEVRLWRRIEKIENGGCWLFHGSKDLNGYGHFWWGGKLRLVHRLVYEALVGKIPDGHQLDHLCRVPSCCNPSHLEAVLPRVNFLRSHNPFAVLRNERRCKNGHDITSENSYTRTRKGKVVTYCKTCELAMWRKHGNWQGREGSGKGESNPKAVLTKANVIDIRAHAATMTTRQLADQFGVTPATIRQIVRRVTWQHVE